jgi:hypothetical protein
MFYGKQKCRLLLHAGMKMHTINPLTRTILTGRNAIVKAGMKLRKTVWVIYEKYQGIDQF